MQMWKVTQKYHPPLDDEVAELLGKVETLAVGQTRRLRVQHLGEHLEVRVASFVRGSRGGQLHQRYAQWPHIGANVVLWFLGVDALRL